MTTTLPPSPRKIAVTTSATNARAVLTQRNSERARRAAQLAAQLRDRSNRNLDAQD